MTAKQYTIKRNKLKHPANLSSEDINIFYFNAIAELKKQLDSVEELKIVLEQEKNMQNKMSSSLL